MLILTFTNFIGYLLSIYFFNGYKLNSNQLFLTIDIEIKASTTSKRTKISDLWNNRLIPNPKFPKNFKKNFYLNWAV